MATITVGLLHPGEMGSVVGQCLRAGGARVLWASGGRSTATRGRAMAAGLEDVATLSALAGESDVIFSVCPPGAATDQARHVAALGFHGIYVDANAVAPATARSIEVVVSTAGGSFVDGGIIGPPPQRAGTTRLYLAGDKAERVAGVCASTNLEAIVMAGPPGTASAIKMAYAAWTKGSSALLMSVRALAMREGVDDALLAEWGRSQRELGARSEAAVQGNARKAWRFVGEMEEIAATFAAAGLPDGFHQACAEIYRRLEAYKDAPTPPSVADVAKALGA